MGNACRNVFVEIPTIFKTFSVKYFVAVQATCCAAITICTNILTNLCICNENKTN